MSDSFDRRILTTYLDEYLGDFLFDTFQPFHFFKNENVDYSVPDTGPRNVYVGAIEALPLVQTPEVFGLHPNADISYYSSSTKALWSNLVEMQPRTGTSGTGMSREEYIGNVANDVRDRIPDPFDLAVLRKEVGTPTPVQVVLLQELERWNLVIHVMRTSLKDLSRALAGEIGFSSSLEALANSLYNGQLPVSWAKANPKTQKMLGSWMLWFERRYRQYQSWAREGEPKVMWISGLHIPETYIAALVQTACRDKGWPLDKSTLYTQVRGAVHCMAMSHCESQAEQTLEDMQSDRMLSARFKPLSRSPLAGHALRERGPGQGEAQVRLLHPGAVPGGRGMGRRPQHAHQTEPEGPGHGAAHLADRADGGVQAQALQHLQGACVHHAGPQERDGGGARV